MNPAAKKLADLRHSRGISQKALALNLQMDQTYLCAIEAGRKGIPRADEFLQKVCDELNLSREEKNELLIAVAASQQKYVVPSSASEDEYRLVNKLMSRLGTLRPAQIAALSYVLEL